MFRCSLAIGIVLLSTMLAWADEPLLTPFGRQHLFFPEMKVVMHHYSPGKTQVDWSIESADRKLQSGVSKVVDDVAKVEFKTPPLKDGVMLELKLVVDGKSQPMFLVSGDVFADQHDWLGDLNIILSEEDETASDILKDADIPFTTTIKAITYGALILVPWKEISTTDYYSLASRGNFVVVFAPRKLDILIHQKTNYKMADSFLLTNHLNQIFSNTWKEDLPFRLFDVLSHPRWECFMLGSKDDLAILETIRIDTPRTGWEYAEFRFTRGGRLLFVNVPVFEVWETLPDSQIFVKLLFDEMKSQQKSLNKEK